MVLDDTFKNGVKKNDTTEAENDNIQANDLNIVSISEKSKEDLEFRDLGNIFEPVHEFWYLMFRS